MGVKIERHTTGAAIEFPGKGFPVKVSREVGGVVVSSSINNLLQQKKIDGGRIKANAPSTRERKRRKGRPRLSLVDSVKRFLKRSNYKITATKNQVSVELKDAADGKGPGVKALSIILQKMGYTGWLGLDDTGVDAVRVVIMDWIDELLAKAARKRSRR